MTPIVDTAVAPGGVRMAGGPTITSAFDNIANQV
jgi:hypothetical protein